MPTLVMERANQDQYVLNHCTKYLARIDTAPRHNYNDEYPADDPRSGIAENWRFPIVDSCGGGNMDEDARFNAVTFVYDAQTPEPVQQIKVVGTFANLYEPIPLKQVCFGGEPTRYYGVTVKVPKGEVHHYKFWVNGKYVMDPINPQTETLDNGAVWSRFFTDLCTVPISFHRTELDILTRLTEHILPFRTTEGRTFLNDYYFYLDRTPKEKLAGTVYQLDEQVGVANFIDKLVAREEYHRLNDYKICLSIITSILNQRRPGEDPAQVSREVYVDLYHEMANGSVDGWDYSRYGNPGFFLQLVRRHTVTGAFSHPKYGGNIGAAGWSFLEQTFCDEQGATLYNWKQAIERPLGGNEDYFG